MTTLDKMDRCYVIQIEKEDPQEQLEAMISFVGGYPRIPTENPLPECRLCGSPQTFFFQIGFPPGHAWADLSLAVFYCTSCADKQHRIPEMLAGPLHQADIPDGFLERYQTNFRFLVFPTGTGVVRQEYTPRVTFYPITLEHSPDPAVQAHKVGGVPSWVLEDESPRSYGSDRSMFFLLQLLQELTFDTVSGAPAQMGIGLDGKPRPSRHPEYKLFLANNVYFFGTRDTSVPAVYAVTQID
jgi:hypothetical protein